MITGSDLRDAAHYIQSGLDNLAKAIIDAKILEIASKYSMHDGSLQATFRELKKLIKESKS